jgi:hypothetical protein
MHGVPYNSRTSRLESAITADKFLCVLCGGLAKIWDHCHDHGMIRGPLCGSCNQVEPILLATPSISWNISPGTGERNPTQRITPQEAITYLHNCKICADYQTLPVHHWAYLAHENLWHTKNRAQLGGCDQWTIEAPCELFRLRNYQAANALVPLLWEPPGEPHTEWICSSHHRPARPHGITSQQVRAASLEQLRVMKIAGLTPPWSI